MDSKLVYANTQNGFNLIELMIAVSIISILLSVGIPSYVDSQKRNNADSNIMKMKSALNEAKQLAIFQARDMVICPPNAAATACDNDWSKGVIIFARSDANATANSFNGIAAGNIISRIYGVKSSIGNFTANTSANKKFFSFDANGFANVLGSIDYCDVSDNSLGKKLTISSSGRIELNNITCP